MTLTLDRTTRRVNLEAIHPKFRQLRTILTDTMAPQSTETKKTKHVTITPFCSDETTCKMFIKGIIGDDESLVARLRSQANQLQL